MLRVYTGQIHWNELLPGDSFMYVYDMTSPPLRARTTITSKESVIMIEWYVQYLVVSRRIGDQHPFPKDWYVLLGGGKLQTVMA